MCFHARPVGGTARPDGVETSDVAWVPPERLGDYDVVVTHRTRISDALSRRGTPRLA